MNPRLLRWAFALGAAATLLSVTALASLLLVYAPTDASTTYHVASRGSDYFEYTVFTAPADHVVRGHWHVVEGQAIPERVFFVSAQDIPALLRGESVAPLREEDASLGSHAWQGTESTTLADWSCERCSDPRPALVWVRGTAWRDQPVEDRAWTFLPDGDVAGPGPIDFRGVIEIEELWWTSPPLVIATLAFGAATVLAGAWWALEAWRSRGQPPSGAAGLLQTTRVAERYLQRLSAWFLAGAVGSVALIGLLMLITLPPVLRQWEVAFPDAPEIKLVFILAGPFAALAAILAWALSFLKLRAEAARWRIARSEIDAFEAHVGE